MDKSHFARLAEVRLPTLFLHQDKSSPTAFDRLRLERDRHVALAFAAADLLIETDEAAAVSRAMGIEFGQGWLFGKPIAEMPEAMRVPSLVAIG